MESIVNYMEPRDIYEKIGTNASELSEAEHGFICGLIRKYKPKKIVELGVSGGGTSVLVLNCLQKLGLNDTKMYSVDLSETYHFNPDKKCGFQIDEAKPYLKNIDNHKLILGKILPEVIEDIAKDGKIDFIILDTTHYLQGELMDFAIAIPFLADNAVVVLDDTSFWFEGENRWAFATKVLFDLCISPNKYYAETPDGFSKIVGFTMPEKTSLWKKNIFDALSMPWHYFADNQIKVYENIVNKYFDKDILDSFKKAVDINRIAINKKDNIKTEIKAVMKQCKESDKKYIYGAGQRGKALLYFLESNGIAIDGVIVSDDRSTNQTIDSNVPVVHLSDIAGDNNLILVAAADEEIRDNLNSMDAEYYDVPNYIFPFVKEYYDVMR